jgi:hypothetical protein
MVRNQPPQADDPCDSVLFAYHASDVGRWWIIGVIPLPTSAKYHSILTSMGIP